MSSSSPSFCTKRDNDVLVDETYFSALFDYDGVIPISDEIYATELCLQEALFSSINASTVETNYHTYVQMNPAMQVKQEPEIIRRRRVKMKKMLCEELQKFGNTKKKSSDEEDALLIQMAKNKQWRKCLVASSTLRKSWLSSYKLQVWVSILLWMWIFMGSSRMSLEQVQWRYLGGFFK